MNKHLETLSDGNLYDTRVSDWHKLPPLRSRYSYHHLEINSVAKLKATLRAGQYAWPGGYEVFFYTSDGGLLCHDCVKGEFTNILWSMQNGCNDGWNVVGCTTSAYLDEAQWFCDHCNKDFLED